MCPDPDDKWTIRYAHYILNEMGDIVAKAIDTHMEKDWPDCDGKCCKYYDCNCGDCNRC